MRSTASVYVCYDADYVLSKELVVSHEPPQAQAPATMAG